MPFPLLEKDDSLEDIIKAYAQIEVNDLMLDYIIKYIKENYQPEEIFDDEQLQQWATDMDYIKDTDDATKE